VISVANWIERSAHTQDFSRDRHPEVEGDDIIVVVTATGKK